MTQKEKEFLEGYQDAMIQFGQRIAHCDRKGIGPNWYYEVAQDMVYDDEPSKQFFCHDKHGNTAYRVIVTERDKGWHKAVDELYDAVFDDPAELNKRLVVPVNPSAEPSKLNVIEEPSKVYVKKQ